MRILIISDIHANLAALEAVLKDAEGKWDEMWFLGDLIGYGPDPNECTELLQTYEPLALSGNHDWAILGKLDIESFNDYARDAVLWARDVIKDDVRDYLDSLPPAMVPHENFSIAHASPRQPIWEYVLDRGTADANFEYFDTPICLVGHTHVPIIFEKFGDNPTHAYTPQFGEVWPLSDQVRRIINPGSVGQPRDSDARAAYALLDLETMMWQHCRVSYDIERTQKKMQDAGLSDRLVARLAYGW